MGEGLIGANEALEMPVGAGSTRAPACRLWYLRR
jgi:hypothetical protein